MRIYHLYGPHSSALSLPASIFTLRKNVRMAKFAWCDLIICALISDIFMTFQGFLLLYIGLGSYSYILLFTAQEYVKIITIMSLLVLARREIWIILVTLTSRYTAWQCVYAHARACDLHLTRRPLLTP